VPTRVIRFAKFEVDLRAGELRKNGHRIRLQDQPFQILAMLLEHPGEIVTREEIRQKLWLADTFVDFDHGLNSAVGRLREALNDSASTPRFIETIPRRGYRFIAQLGVESSAAEEPAVASKRAVGILRFWRYAPITISVALLMMVAITFLVRQTHRVAATSPIRSLVVLPLESLSDDPQQDYFTDGMTDELITSLGQISSLRVISRTSAMKYRGVHRSLPEVARELKVDAVVEGTVLRSGDKVRITAQLIQASEDRHMWAGSFEGDVKDVLALQHEISGAIASQVEMTLLPGAHIRPAINRPLNLEAYEAYLKGEYYLNRFQSDSIQQAAKYFQLAIERDPAYVPAYAKLAGCYRILANMNVFAQSVGNEKAKPLVAKALELDPNFGPAHAVKGWGLLFYDLDFASAGEEFKRAVELNPNSVEGHQGLGEYYATIGQARDAVREVERARELDPLATIVNHSLCQTLTFARQYDEALAQCKANLDLDPNSARTLWVLSDIYAAKGMEPEALSALLQGLKLTGLSSSTIAAAQAGASRGGLKGCWQALIPAELDGVRNGGLDPFSIAIAYTRAGDADNALLWLLKAVKARCYGITFLAVDPTFDSLRSDPRFQELLRRMNFPA